MYETQPNPQPIPYEDVPVDIDLVFLNVGHTDDIEKNVFDGALPEAYKLKILGDKKRFSLIPRSVLEQKMEESIDNTYGVLVVLLAQLLHHLSWESQLMQLYEEPEKERRLEKLKGDYIRLEKNRNHFANFLEQIATLIKKMIDVLMTIHQDEIIRTENLTVEQRALPLVDR